MTSRRICRSPSCAHCTFLLTVKLHCESYSLASMPASCSSPGQCASGQTCLMPSQMCLCRADVVSTDM